MKSEAATVLIVDDDPELVDLLEPALKRAGYKVRIAAGADEAFAVMTRDAIDLVLLDIELGGISGLKLLELMKREPRTAAVPVILQTTHGREGDKVGGLAAGADDYVTKPFSVKELLARVDALLRRFRHEGRLGRVLEAAGIRVDLDAREVFVKGKRAELTALEFELLTRLLQRPDQVMTYEVLSEALSEGARIMTSANLYQHVKNLRQKLGSAGGAVATVYGVGYKFDARFGAR